MSLETVSSAATAGVVPAWSTLVAVALFGALCALDRMVPSPTEASVAQGSPVALHQPDL